MEAKYSENQSGLWIVLILFSIGLLSIFPILTKDINIISHWLMLMAVGIIIICGLLFYNLKTSVFRDKIRLTFGIGIIQKNIDMSLVKSVEVVRNNWIYGWGIRYVFNGWMWNIYGLDAVELKFKDKKSIFRIGSQHPKNLKEKIEEMINN